MEWNRWGQVQVVAVVVVVMAQVTLCTLSPAAGKDVEEEIKKREREKKSIWS